MQCHAFAWHLQDASTTLISNPSMSSMSHSSINYYKSSRWRSGQRSSIQHVRTSAHYIGYNHVPYLVVLDKYIKWRELINQQCLSCHLKTLLAVEKALLQTAPFLTSTRRITCSYSTLLNQTILEQLLQNILISTQTQECYVHRKRLNGGALLQQHWPLHHFSTLSKY